MSSFVDKPHYFFYDFLSFVMFSLIFNVNEYDT